MSTDMKNLKDAIRITVRHTGDNTMSGSLAQVLSIHLAKGWELESVSLELSDETMAREMAKFVRDEIRQGIEKAMETVVDQATAKWAKREKP